MTETLKFVVRNILNRSIILCLLAALAAHRLELDGKWVVLIGTLGLGLKLLTVMVRDMPSKAQLKVGFQETVITWRILPIVAGLALMPTAYFHGGAGMVLTLGIVALGLKILIEAKW